jgi:hypothetical protein
MKNIRKEIRSKVEELFTQRKEIIDKYGEDSLQYKKFKDKLHNEPIDVYIEYTTEIVSSHFLKYK